MKFNFQFHQIEFLFDIASDIMLCIFVLELATLLIIFCDIVLRGMAIISQLIYEFYISTSFFNLIHLNIYLAEGMDGSWRNAGISVLRCAALIHTCVYGSCVLPLHSFLVTEKLCVLRIQL